jgi:hypothetical protein
MLLQNPLKGFTFPGAIAKTSPTNQSVSDALHEIQKNGFAY